MPIEEVADTIVIVLIFNRAIMEKTNPSYPFAVTGKEEERR
jgi:hypothetical protein